MDLRGLPPWAGLRQVPEAEASVIVAGIAYDGSAVYRPGAAQAPAAIRTLSACMPPVDEHGRALAQLTVSDAGDLTMTAGVEEGWPEVAGRLADLPGAAFLTVLGGDHCAAIPVLAAQARRHPGLGVLWVDAHPDLCDTSRGGRWTCGCALRRALEAAQLSPRSVALIGCRDFDPEEVAFLEREGMTMVTAAELDHDPVGAVARVARSLEGRAVHVSFDIDALDPSAAPGTEIAAAGGLSTRQALRALSEVAAAVELVGLDVCEVAPPLDHADVTVLAALKLIFETWSLCKRPAAGESTQSALG